MERGLGREPEHETDPSREGSGPRVKNEPREPADESGSRALSARSDKHDAIVVNDDQADPYDEIEDLVGTLIAGKYQVERLIGRGSTGAVYLCQHLGLDKLVALKILHREMKQNPGFVDGFKREAQAASRLEHPNSVRVLDFGEDPSGYLYIAMEYIEGRDLLRVLEEDGPFSAERAIDVMSQILDALSVAHGLGIVHRDLKPENVVVRASQVDGVYKDLVTVCDFGIAQFSSARLPSAAATSSVDVGMVAGTPAYMPPEQARAEPQDARSDIYSAGVVLFQLLTLHLPFEADDALAVAVKHCSELPPRPSQFGAVSPALEEICLKALSKTREARFQTAREMRVALQRALVATPLPRNRRINGLRWGTTTQSGTRPVRTPSTPSSLMPREIRASSTTQRTQLMPRPRRGRKLGQIGFAMLLLLGVAGVSQRMFGGGHEGGVRPAASNLVRPSSAEPMQAEAPALADVPPAIPAGAAPPPPSASDLAPSDDEVVPPVAIASLDYLAHEGSLPAPLAQAEQQPALAAVRPAAEAPVLARAETSMSKGRPAANVPAANTRAGKRAAVSSRRKAPEPAEPASASAAAPSAAVSAPEPAMSREVSTTQDPLPGLVERADEAPQQSVPVVPAPVVVADVSSSRAALAAASSLPPTAASSEPPTAAPVPSRARVAIGAIAARAAVSKASVRGALNMDAITGCYRTALRSGRESGNPVTAQIDVVTSTSGSVTSAQMRGSGLSSDLRHCIEQVARRGRVREADTGEAQASITLEFEPR